ncbi:hypothetical protein [Sphingobium nicotianae]|uniref:Uncharacterized protein n=1 Tax=Sphingobium nicotianae TaxID=2782607 RepID=A0A9X1ISX4_9SPHN|nr:hypothetical protein [Sphingobium nicotianae]MBT2188772.1 hypothetical protein [Sphingobium nicotianae]
MLAFAGLTYSALLSFVLSSAARNRRAGVAHPPILTAVGYVLCGLSVGAAGLLPVWAAYNPAGVAALNTLTVTL